MSKGRRRAGEQKKGPTGAEGLLGQDRRLDRLAGSRAPGIGLGCPLGLGGSGFCRRLGGKLGGNLFITWGDTHSTSMSFLSPK